MKLRGLRTVLREVGALVLIVSLVPLTGIPVALHFGTPRGVTALVVTSALFAAVGLALRAIPPSPEPNQRQAMMIAAVGWLIVPLLSVVPLMMLEGMSFLDAYFEMMSGWSGTGLSILDVENAYSTTLWWRSLCQWVGGVGVIVLTLTVLARPGSAAFALYKGEARDEKLRPNVIGTVRTIWWIYAIYTGGFLLAFWFLTPLDLWDAANHTLTGISTAGFSIYPDSLARYDNWTLTLFVLLMIAGATPFIAHYSLLKGHVGRFWADVQFRWMVAIIAIGTVPALATVMIMMSAEEGFMLAFFQWASAVTSTGFQSTGALGEWPAIAKMFLALGMIVGGSAGSTAGGIKIVRAALVAKGVAWKVHRASLPPFAVTSFRFGRRRLPAHEANRELAEAAFVTFLWLIALVILLFSLLALGHAAEDAIFESVTVISNNGMSVGITSPDMPDWLKIAFMAGMWAGRLEIFPVLILLRSILLRGPMPR